MVGGRELRRPMARARLRDAAPPAGRGRRCAGRGRGAGGAGGDLDFELADDPRVVGAAAALVATLALAWRRRAPLASALVALGTMALFSTVWSSSGLAVLVVMLSSYSVATHCDLRGASVGGTLALAVAALATLQEDNENVGQFLENFIFVAGLMVALPWAAGRALRGRRLQSIALEHRAVALEREGEERARAAVAEERLRIARELHDVVGHALGVIVVQAGAERATLDANQQSTRETLITIEGTGREALSEMRRLLEMMRRDDEQVALAPQPSLTQLDTLVEHVRAAGLPVDLHVDGRADAPATGRRPLGLPDRAGGAHQRPQARRARRGRASLSATPTTTSGSRSRMMGPARGEPSITTATACSACASGSRSTAGRCAAAPGRAAAMRSASGSRSSRRRHEHPRPYLRRPGARARGLSQAAGGRGRESRSSARRRTASKRSSSYVVARPDLALMDIRMPRLDGIEATRRIVARLRADGTRTDVDDLRQRPVRLRVPARRRQRLPAQGRPARGAPGSRSDRGQGATRCSHPRLRGRWWRPSCAAHPPDPELTARLDGLTTREGEVFQLLAAGNSNSAIASALSISEATVKTHVGHVLTKLDIRDRVQAVIFAYESGIVTPSARPAPTPQSTD